MGHFSTRHQTDPIAMNCFYLQKSTCSQVLVEITLLKMSSKGYCIVGASSKQRKDNKRLSTLKDYNAQDWTEKVRTVIMMGNMDSEKGMTLFTDRPEPPLTEHCEPFEYVFMAEKVNCLYDTRYLAKEGKLGKAETTQIIGFSDGRSVDLESIPFWCDMYIGPSYLDEKNPAWCPTLQMEIQFKSKIKNTQQILVHFLVPHIINSRYDIDGQIWDMNGKLLALTRHQCLIVPWSKNSMVARKNKI
ncbi:unnamed protein product [Rhizopus stolonifer]